jgi:hypothetical protein
MCRADGWDLLNTNSSKNSCKRNMTSTESRDSLKHYFTTFIPLTTSGLNLPNEKMGNDKGISKDSAE